MHRRRVLAIATGILVPGSGCVGNDNGSEEPTITVDELAFLPRDLAVESGTTVTWINEDSTVVPPHTVTSTQFFDDAEEWQFDVEFESEGDEATYTFEEDGLYTYIDEHNEGSHCGAVVVGDASLDRLLPCI